MSYIQGYDPHTLREIVDVSQCRERLGELGDQRSLPALLERVWLLKVTGEFDEALAVSEQSVRVARMGGPRKDLLRARVLHATVLQARSAYAAAIQELTTCGEEAEGQGWSALAAFAYQHRGKVFGLLETFTGGLTPIGMAVGGLLGEVLPIRWVIGAAFAFVGLYIFPQLGSRGIRGFFAISDVDDDVSPDASGRR